VRSGALDAADDGRGGVEDGVLSCPDVDPSRNQIHHTQCGAGALADDTFHRTYAERIGAEMASKLAFSAWLLACCSGSSHPPGRVWITVARQPPPPHLSIDHPPALDLALRQQQGAGAAGVEGNPRGEGVALPALLSPRCERSSAGPSPVCYGRSASALCGRAPRTATTDERGRKPAPGSDVCCSSAAVARPQPTTCSFPGRKRKRAMAPGTSAVCRCIARESLVVRSAGLVALLNR
jgi:hypothetical protein